MLASASLLAIRGYQRWISPRKGYSCTHRVLHGGTGCSGYAKAALKDHGFWRAVPLIRQRFRDCAAAAAELQARRAALASHSSAGPDAPPPAGGGDAQNGSSRKKRWHDYAPDCGDCCYVGRCWPAGKSASAPPASGANKNTDCDFNCDGCKHCGCDFFP